MISVTRIFLAALVLSVVFFALLTFYNRNPLEKKWTYTGRFSVLNPDTLTVSSYPSDRSSIITITLPQNVFIIVPGGYGNYKIEDVRELGRSEKRGDDLLVESISYLIGIPIEALSHRLSYWEMYTIWQIKQDKEITTFTIDLSKYPITTSETRSDGSKIDLINPAKIDYYLKDTFWERDIRDDNYSIGIYNASDTPGLATYVSRKLETVGFRVVEVTNWDESVGKECQIRVRNDEALYKSASLSRLVQITSCLVVEGVDVSGRFDIQLVLTHAI